MFIRSSTAVNDCLIALDCIQSIAPQKNDKTIGVTVKYKLDISFTFYYDYESEEIRDKAFNELCAFLNSNYKLRDFT